jgi:two-component system, cell cycle sensor histidine kinase and response regulator CckA
LDNLNGNNTILIVDDEPVVLKVAAMMVKKLNFEVLQAINGMEASQVFSDNKDIICLVILDMQLPDENGSDTCKKLKAIKSDVKILHTSGLGKLQGNESLDCGCNGFLPKPFRMEELSDKLEGLLEKEI